MTRICPRCRRDLPLTPEFFHRHGARLHYECRECTSEERKEKYAADPEKYKARARQYRAANPDKAKETLRRSYATHRAERNMASRAYYARNAAKMREQERQRREADPGRSYLRQWRSSGCLVCGEGDIRCIHVHHIDPALKDHSMSFYAKRPLVDVAAELEKCVPLCANHHAIVHDELRNGHKGQSLEEVVAYLKGD